MFNIFKEICFVFYFFLAVFLVYLPQTSHRGSRFQSLFPQFPHIFPPPIKVAACFVAFYRFVLNFNEISLSTHGTTTITDKFGTDPIRISVACRCLWVVCSVCVCYGVSHSIRVVRNRNCRNRAPKIPCMCSRLCTHYTTALKIIVIN